MVELFIIFVVVGLLQGSGRHLKDFSEGALNPPVSGVDEESPDE